MRRKTSMLKPFYGSIRRCRLKINLAFREMQMHQVSDKDSEIFIFSCVKQMKQRQRNTAK